jgi:hypothetical protein
MDFPNRVMLTNSELTVIRNSDAQKRICELEKQKLLMQEEIWLNNVSDRLKLDIRRYNIDIQTGICMLIRPEDPSQKQPEPTQEQEKETEQNTKSQDETNAKLQAGHPVRKQPKGSTP